MRCPYCGADDDKVIDSRPAEGGEAIRRRRQCLRCEQRFSTYERVERADLMVRKRSGRTQPFDPERIAEGMRRAAANLDIDPERVTLAVAQVEARVRALNQREVGSDQIGQQVLEALRDLHHVAYVRFASVYKGFTSTEDFVKELRELGEEPPRA